MPRFQYKGVNGEGKQLQGTMRALDELDLHVRLNQEGILLVSAKSLEKKTRARALKTKDLADFCRQIGTLTGAGVSLVRALTIISQDETIHPRERGIYTTVLRNVRQGVSLADAMDEQGSAFPALLIHMFHAAESSGGLDRTAMRMAVHYDKQYRTEGKVRSAMVYPKILGCVIGIVILFMFTFIMPQFEDLFSQMEELPAITRFLFFLTGLVKTKWPFLIGVTVFAVLALRLVFSLPKVVWYVDKCKVKLPMIGILQKKIYTARFARTVSSLYVAGIPIVTVLQVARKTIGNAYIEGQFDQVIAQVRAGGTLSDALEQVDGFVKKMAAAIRVGEETGSMDTMLDSNADAMEYEAEMATQKMVSLMEPLMIIVMGIIIAVVMLGVMMPLYGSYDAIGAGTY